MRFNLYRDVRKMYQDTYATLMQNEVLNTIILGNLIIGNNENDKSGWRNTDNWFMATITIESRIVLIALMTPPHNLTLYEVEKTEGGLRCLIEGLIKNNIEPPGVMCEKTLAENFAAEYAKKIKCKYNVVTNQGIYELEKVKINANLVGSLRPLQESDLSFFPYWFESAMSDFHDAPIHQVSNNALDYSRQKGIYVLEDAGTCVSMARITREMETCCCVSMVYTPPYFRNRGYATSCVAEVSRKALERGFKKCVLYADLDYSVSNSIYKKIGYSLAYNSSVVTFIKR